LINAYFECSSLLPRQVPGMGNCSDQGGLLAGLCVEEGIWKWNYLPRPMPCRVHLIKCSVLRTASVWIFQLWFSLVWFSISSTQFHFFGFSIRISPQCKSILVCENTKTESTYFDGTPSHSCMYGWVESKGCCFQLSSWFIVDL